MKPLEAEVNRLIEFMSKLDPDTEEYTIAAKNLEVLTRTKSPKLSPDSILGAVVNLVGIVVIINHERLNVITTRAFSLLRTGKF